MKRRSLVQGSIGLGLGAVSSQLVSCQGRLPFGAKLKGEATSGPALVEINLSKGISERGASSLFGAIPNTGWADLIRVIHELDKDDTKGIFLRIGSAGVGLSMARELGLLLKQVREERKIKVVGHADDLSNGSLVLVALGCDEIWMSPAGTVHSVGIAFSLVFGRELLDKLAVGVDFLQVGKYKGAKEPYTNTEPSPEARETLEGTLKDLRKAWLDSITEGRGNKDLEPAIEDGPYTAKAAKEAGLIDAVGYVDDAITKAKEACKAERRMVAFGGGAAGNEGGGIGQLIKTLSGAEAEGVPHVALVRAIGAITMAPAGAFGGGDGITESGLGKVLSQLTEDDAAKAVVLRIDSPGGSALASDLLWHKLMKLREKKPLVISIGGMAASGGYYLSCAGSRIFAHATSIVGSIGVVAGKFALHDTLKEKLYVNTVTISAAPDERRKRRTSYLSPFDPWDDATREKVLAGMEGMYETFLDRIVEGRELDRETVKASAEGRIFGGATALERKLIDEIGGLDEAVKYALDKSGLGADGKVRTRDPAAGLLELFGGDEEAAASAAQRARDEIDPFAKVAEALPEEARLWLASAAPMAQGETMLTALPYALAVR